MYFELIYFIDRKLGNYAVAAVTIYVAVHPVCNSEISLIHLAKPPVESLLHSQFIGTLDFVCFVAQLERKTKNATEGLPSVRKQFTSLQSLVSHCKHTASCSVALSLSSLPDGWWRKCSLWCARLEEPCLDFLLNTSFIHSAVCHSSSTQLRTCFVWRTY